MLTKQEIEWGKNNRTAWGWLTPDEKSIFTRAQRYEILQSLYSDKKEDWHVWVSTIEEFQRIYRIDPVYQPGPEVERAEMGINGWGRYEYCYKGEDHTAQIAPTQKNFICFEFADGYQSQNYRMGGDSKKGIPAAVAKYVLFAKE